MVLSGLFDWLCGSPEEPFGDSESDNAEADLDRLIDLLHGLGIDDTEPLYQAHSVYGTDLVEQGNGSHRQAGSLVGGKQGVNRVEREADRGRDGGHDGNAAEPVGNVVLDDECRASLLNPAA